MELRGKSVALYGRFTAGARDRLAAEIIRRGGAVARDFTRRSDVLVVGASATPLIEGGRLAARLKAARARRAPVFAERRFSEMLGDETAEEGAATFPLAAVAEQLGFSQQDTDVFSAFDVIRVEGDKCRFGDAATLKTAAEIIAAGRSLTDAVRILAKARDLAPKGRRKIVIGPGGEAALQWEAGLTTLEGQFYLPLDEQAASVEDLFEAAELAEAHGDVAEAVRLYDMSARADRKDPIAPFNLGNLKLRAKACDEAVLAYRTALARDPDFVEARYNLAQAYEALGKLDLAIEELKAALKLDPDLADARFNLAQLELKRGDLKAAKADFEAYLSADPPADWAAKAKKAVTYCAARLSGGGLEPR
jgi:tetratricopeptide (TPR) repeat protein